MASQLDAVDRLAHFMAECEPPLPSRNPDRIPALIAALTAFWFRHPDLRLGQIVEVMTNVAGYRDTFYVEDDEILRALRRELDDPTLTLE